MAYLTLNIHCLNISYDFSKEVERSGTVYQQCHLGLSIQLLHLSSDTVSTVKQMSPEKRSLKYNLFYLSPPILAVQ
jgi:hypothetical protein